MVTFSNSIEHPDIEHTKRERGREREGERERERERESLYYNINEDATANYYSQVHAPFISLYSEDALYSR